MKPIKDTDLDLYEDNQIQEDSPFGGKMYETFGSELRYITDLLDKDYKTNIKRLHTIVEEDGIYYANPGYHVVNAIGYLILKTN